MTAPDPDRSASVEAIAAYAEPLTQAIHVALTACASDAERGALAGMLIGFVDGHEPHALEAYVETSVDKAIGDAVRAAFAKPHALPLTAEKASQLALEAYKRCDYQIVDFGHGRQGVLRCPKRTIELMNTYQALLMNAIEGSK